MRSWDHLSRGITQYYLSPDRGDSLRIAGTHLSTLRRMKGWVDLSTVRDWTVSSELLCDDITGANCSIVKAHWAGVCERLVQGRRRLKPATFRSSSHYSSSPPGPTVNVWLLRCIIYLLSCRRPCNCTFTLILHRVTDWQLELDNSNADSNEKSVRMLMFLC